MTLRIYVVRQAHDEHWGVPDQLGMLVQLGLFGRPEPVAVAR